MQQDLILPMSDNIMIDMNAARISLLFLLKA